MAGGTVDVGTGTTLVFGTSSFTSELLSVGHSGISRVSIETSHMGTAAPGAGKFGNMTFIPGDLSDPGELSVEFHFDPDQLPPIDKVKETITVTFPLVAGDATAAKFASDGFMTDFEYTDDLETKMTATATIKLSGEVTQTVAA